MKKQNQQIKQNRTIKWLANRLGIKFAISGNPEATEKSLRKLLELRKDEICKKVINLIMVSEDVFMTGSSELKYNRLERVTGQSDLSMSGQDYAKKWNNLCSRLGIDEKTTENLGDCVVFVGNIMITRKGIYLLNQLSANKNNLVVKFEDNDDSFNAFIFLAREKNASVRAAEFAQREQEREQRERYKRARALDYLKIIAHDDRVWPWVLSMTIRKMKKKDQVAAEIMQVIQDAKSILVWEEMSPYDRERFLKRNGITDSNVQDSDIVVQGVNDAVIIISKNGVRNVCDQGLEPIMLYTPAESGAKKYQAFEKLAMDRQKVLEKQKWAEATISQHQEDAENLARRVSLLRKMHGENQK